MIPITGRANKYMGTFFSDTFGVDHSVVDAYGAFDISIINDLPLFIDPFLLFHSDKAEYQALHESIIEYLVFLRDKSAKGRVSDGLLQSWYCFPEVKQNWFGFSLVGNGGSGLGMNFARALHTNLNLIFPDFGSESITESSHLEKVCLIADGVGRDNISDFVTNLILDFLCQYTQDFCIKHLRPDQLKTVSIRRAKFNFKTEAWQQKTYKLPWLDGDYVLLTPKDMLTRDDTWINRGDLIRQFEEIPSTISDASLRANVGNYFQRLLRERPKNRRQKPATTKEKAEAAAATIRAFPELIDYYIKLKEIRGDDAVDISADRVLFTELLFSTRLREILHPALAQTDFYKTGVSTYEEAHIRLAYLKTVIEDQGGWRIFYDKDGNACEREKDIQILYRLVWFGTPSDAGMEANDGRGPVDFKISRGRDKTLVEMKLAKNTHLEKNLANQVEIYQKASDAKSAIKVIIYFDLDQLNRVKRILKKLGLAGHKDIVLIDGRKDNKISASKVSK